MGGQYTHLDESELLGHVYFAHIQAVSYFRFLWTAFVIFKFIVSSFNFVVVVIV